MKKLYFLLWFALIPALVSAQQTGSISGLVTDSTGRAIEDAVVFLENTNFSTATDKDGLFTFLNIPPGQYLLMVTMVGDDIESKTVEVQAGIDTSLTIYYTKGINILDPVILTSRKAELKSNLTTSVSVIDNEQLRDQELIYPSAGDIVSATVPGVGISTGTSSNWGQTLRGRPMLVMIDGIPQSTPLRNGAVDMRTIDPYVLDRIEVVKGATAIYGNGAAGGIINYITASNNYKKKFGGRTEIGTSGSLTNSANSFGPRIYQSLYGKSGKFDYTASGSFQQTGIYKDAEGDPIGPLYGLSNNEIWNFFGKAGYDIDKQQRVEFTYNFFSSEDKTNLTEVRGNAKQGIKTTAGPGLILGEPLGTRWNHNVLLRYNNNKITDKTSLSVSTYMQSISTVFYYSPDYFQGGGQSSILSNKKGLRFDANTSFGILNNNIEGYLIYGVDLLQDKTSQPLVDGRFWVPEMNMRNLAPFLQLQSQIKNHLVLNGGVRLENVNIQVPDYQTLSTLNSVTGAYTESINVKGGSLNYNNLVFNTGIKYTKHKLFLPFANFSQGFSVADLGVTLRRATVDNMAKIQTSPVIVNNYETGFQSFYKRLRFEGVAFVSTSELGSSYKEVDGVFQVARAPELVYGYEVQLAAIFKMAELGGSFAYVEGKRDEDDNGEFKEDVYLGGDRIAPPKFTAFVKATPVKGFAVRLDYLGSGNRRRFEKNPDTGHYNNYEGVVKPYHIFNLSASYKMSKETMLRVGVENLLNENYFPARSQWLMIDSYYIKGRGRTLTLAVSTTF